ncbi:MAG: MlaE family lipid ABC transporter permease subunit [Candidatus Binatia bacterium]
MSTATAITPRPNGLLVSHPRPDALCVQLLGSWTIQGSQPATIQIEQQLAGDTAVRRLTFDAAGLTAWDSSVLTFLLKVRELCARRQIDCDPSGLPSGVQGLLRLATAVPERTGARRETVTESLLVRIGKATQTTIRALPEVLDFLGQTIIAFGRLVRGKARFRRADFALIVQECGAQALPIVSLISFLVGLILAFVGAVQLRQFGAQIYVADLVGIAMVREMGAMMTGIVMAGRTGAAFAAQLGTMMVNEEIDALSTTGLPPMEFLVLPRMLALVLMVPLLCLYADLLGILGGAFIGVSMLDLGIVQYYNETQAALTLTTFFLGLIKAAVFGVVVALAGCLRGMQCGRSAAAVGEAATSAVVTAIVWIILTDALLTVVYEVIGV